MKQIPVNSLPKGDKELKVLPLGHFTPYDFQRPHRHTYFEFFLFEKGGGSHFIDFKEYPIADYSVHIVFPQQIHLVKRKEGSLGSIILCSRHYMNLLGTFYFTQLLQHAHAHPCLQFTPQQFAALMDEVLRLYDELQEVSELSYRLSQSYTSIFLSHCIRQAATGAINGRSSIAGSDHDRDIYRRFCDLVEPRFIDKAGVSFYAGALAMSPKALNSALGRVTGKTAVELIQERMLVEAKRLLLHTGDSIKEIAFQLNFKDNSYFTRFFIRQEGCTPKDFRAYWEEKYHS